MQSACSILNSTSLSLRTIPYPLNTNSPTFAGECYFCATGPVEDELARLLNKSLPGGLTRSRINNAPCMYWTLELASHLEDAPWPATRDELIDYAIRSGSPLEVIENLQAMEDEGDTYEAIDDIWPDYPRKDDFLFNEDEY